MVNKANNDAYDSSSDGLSSSTTPIAVAVAIPSAPPLVTVTADPQSNEEAQASVAAAREQGITNIRDHCEQHLSQNPDSSYITWIATLHPENAQVSIDPRFMIPGNPWLAVYSEAREDLRMGRVYALDHNGMKHETVSPTPPLNDDVGDDGEKAGTKKFVGCLDFILGSALILLSTSASFAFELGASYCYLSYWLCSKIVDRCSPPNMFTWLPLCIAFILGKIFQLLDTLLLIVSIILVESVAGSNYLLCTMLACSHDRGKTIHQMTRKMPHLVRWGFRQKFEEWDPPRTHFSLGLASSE